jgi:hypothetical protein
MICATSKGSINGKAKAACRGVGLAEEDLKHLRALAKGKLSQPEAAKKRRRTRGAVAQKAMKLKIRFRSIRRS